MTDIQNMYAEKLNDGSFTHVYPSTIQVGMCGVDTKDVVSVSVSEHEDGTHHGWKDEDGFSMIFESLIQLKICFPYGMQVEIDKGGGTPVVLQVVENKP